MEVNWVKLKTASAWMLKNAQTADTKIKDLEEWAAKASEAKESWKTIKEEAGTALASSQALDNIAEAKDEGKAEQAGKELQSALAAAKKAVGLVKPLKDKAAADSEEGKGLGGLSSALGQVTAREKAAKEALGEGAKPAEATEAEKPPAATETSPAPAPTPGAPPAARPPAAQGEKTPAENAVAAAAKASEQAGTADKEAKEIEKADSLEKMKAAAEKVATPAGEAQKHAAEAKTQADKAKAAAKDAEKKPWEEAARAADAASTDAGALVTAAKAIANKKTTDEVKAAAKEVVAAATKAIGSAKAAKTAVDAAKGTQPAAPAGAAPAGTAAPGTTKAEKKDEKKQVPNSFGLSITAAYSRKFSLDTTMHSKLEVTMVPYPPPQQFLDWIRAHYNKEKP